MNKGCIALGIAPLLAGCMAIPLASPLRTASLTLKANFIESSSFKTQVVKTTYAKANVFHLRLDLYRGVTLVATKDVLNAALDNPITIQNLRVNTDYQVRCFAYSTAGEASPISLNDASSHTDIHVETNDTVVVSPIQVKLIDTIFGAQGTNSIVVTDGVFLPNASESF